MIQHMIKKGTSNKILIRAWMQKKFENGFPNKIINAPFVKYKKPTKGLHPLGIQLLHKL